MAAKHDPTALTFVLSPDEVRAAVSLIEDQLFRVKFIDPKMPGHRADKERIRAAESALERLKAAGKHHLGPNSHGSSDVILPQKAAASPSFHTPEPRQRSVRGRA